MSRLCKKRPHLAPVLLIALAVASAAAAVAPTPSLKVGSPAPKLQTGKWLQGEPVKQFQKGKVYLIEFWATWSAPCRDAVPVLNQLQNKFRNEGLVVIGQNCGEKDEASVEPFIKNMGNQISYRVALDDKQGSTVGRMVESWMAEAGRTTLPVAFLVDGQGVISWIGDPRKLSEEIIRNVLSGKVDLNKAAREYELQQKKETELHALWLQIGSAIQQKNWSEASAKLAEAERIVPVEERDTLELARFNLLLAKGDYAAAYQAASQTSRTYKDNALLQNELAWQIATDKSVTNRDLPLAELIARRANDAAGAKNPGILDTLARVLFMQGKQQEAIAFETRAVELADGSVKARLEQVLAGYKKGELPRTE